MNGRKLLGEYLAERSRAELAQDVPMSQAHLSQFLTGKKRLSIEKAERLAEITGIPAWRLLGLKDAA